MARMYRDWQFFNRKPEGSKRLMQAIYTGLRWQIGFGFDPARFWISRLGNNEKYTFHFHCYLPFNNIGVGFFPTIGWRRKDGTWKQFKRAIPE